MYKPVSELLEARKSLREVIDPISVGRVPKINVSRDQCEFN